MGFRSGAAKSLDSKGIPYIVWSDKELKSSSSCKDIIYDQFPKNCNDLVKYKDQLRDVTHVIALTEAGVIPAGLIRSELNLIRNTKSVVRRCTDKLKMKEYLVEKNIPMTQFRSSFKMTANTLVSQLGLPLVCKEKFNSGGRGVKFIENENEIEKYIHNKNYFEKAIDGIEGSIESLIVNREIIFTNITQYYKKGECNLVPGDYDLETQEKILKLNTDVIKALNLKWGMTHLEYYITNTGILFGEVALRPPGGYIMEALGLSYKCNFWDHFIDVELLKTDLPKIQLSQYSCTIIIHPGHGIVEKVMGREVVDDLSSKVKFKLKLKEGDVLDSRIGVGQDYGHLILSHSNKKSLMNDLEKFYTSFRITLK